MTEHQFHTVADLLGLSGPDRTAAHRAIFSNETHDAAVNNIVGKIRDADAAIRAAYVVHGPMEFRITVGHRDTHRGPGTLTLDVGDIVRLVAQSTERWIPVRVTALPQNPTDYYHGVITEQLVSASRYQVGNGVMFSEDQVMVEAPRAASSWRPRRGYR